MPRAPLPHLCALVAGAAAALAVGCGDRSHLIPVDEAQTLKGYLAEVQQQVDAGNCDAADAAVDRASEAAQDLDAQQLDRRLRRRILDGIQQLRETVPRDCEQTDTTTVETTPETVETETTPPETAPETTTAEPPTTTAEPPATTPTTPTTTTPDTPDTPTQTTPDADGPDTGGPDTGGTEDVPTP